MKDVVVSNALKVAETKDISVMLRWRVIALCALVCFLDGYDMVVAPISVPILAESWSVQVSVFTSALTATLVGMSLGAVFLAPYGDQIGRKPLIIFGFALVGVSSLVTALVDSVWQLTLCRLITGVGMGASLANAIALAADFSPDRLRSRVTTLVYSLSAVGGVTGSYFAPHILEQTGWAGLYWIGGVIPLILLPLLLIALKDSRTFSERSFSIEHTPKRTGEFITGLQRLLSPLYRDKTLLLWCLYFLSTFTTYLISSWLPTLMRLYGWTMEDSVHAIMSLSAGGIFGGCILGWLVDRGFARFALMLGFVSAACAMLILKSGPSEEWVWMLMIAVVGGGMIGITFTTTALAAVIYPTELRAGGVGTASAVGRIGSTLAPIAGGGLLAAGLSVTDVFTCLIAILLVGIAVVFFHSQRLTLKVVE